ncbi:MAG: hypothetical protein AB7E08_05915 [Candidatus Omnitrophota bacterium]
MITRNNFKIIAFLFCILMIRSAEAFYSEGYFDKIGEISPNGMREGIGLTPVQTPLTITGNTVKLPDMLAEPEKPSGIDAPYCKYISLFHLAPFYIVLDEHLGEIIDKAIGNLGVEKIKSLLYPYSLSLSDLRSTLIFLLKSPYYEEGILKISAEALLSVPEDTRLLYSLAQDLATLINPGDREYIRNFDVSRVEPDIKPWPEFWYISEVWEKVSSQGILEGKVDYQGIEDYKDEIERAVISAIAGFNYDTDLRHLLSREFTDQAMADFYNRLDYWLKTQEYIPLDLFDEVSNKARELFGKLRLIKGLFPDSPWQGEIAQIYRLLGGEIPTRSDPGKLPDSSDWGEDIYKRLWDISSYIEKTDSQFGILLKGPDMTIEQLKDKIRLIGPAIVRINKEGNTEFVRILEITSDGNVIYQDAQNNLYSMDLTTEFIPAWDGFVYVPEERTSYLHVVSDFDFNPGSFSLIKGYGQWAINKFDELKARIGINANIPIGESLPYFYTQFQVGGEETWQYSGYFQGGIWLTFDDKIKSQLLRGTALVFDTFISDYPGIKYVKIELKEEGSGKIISEFIIPRERLNLSGWNTFKIPIHYYLPGTLSLAVGIIGSYPGLYNPCDFFIAMDKIYIE